MKKIPIKRIIEFRRKSDKAKKNFATNLSKDREKSNGDGGGDYWISCLSAISNSFKFNDLKLVSNKKDELEGKYEKTENKRTKTMYGRNIDILYNYEDFDLKKWKPIKDVSNVKKNKEDLILNIKGLQIQADPHHVFTFKKKDKEEIGAIWFIAKLGGYRKEELGMFTDILYRYLNTHFSREYGLNPKYCIAVDVFNNFDLSYSQLENGEAPLVLNSTLDEIKKLM
jgi:hypothetical protein